MLQSYKSYKSYKQFAGLIYKITVIVYSKKFIGFIGYIGLIGGNPHCVSSGVCEQVPRLPSKTRYKMPQKKPLKKTSPNMYIQDPALPVIP